MSWHCSNNFSNFSYRTEFLWCTLLQGSVFLFRFPFTQGFIRLSLWQTTAKEQSGGGALTWITLGIQGQGSSVFSSISPLVILQALWLNGCLCGTPDRAVLGPALAVTLSSVLGFTSFKNCFYAPLGLLGSPSVQTSEKMDSSQVRAFILSFLCLDCVYTKNPYIRIL